MTIRIPANYRQSVKWLANLDAGSAVTVIGGAIVGLHTFTGTAPWVLKIPEIVGAGGGGFLLGTVRWPFDLHGDRLTVWMRRAVFYAQRSRMGSAWTMTPEREGHR